MDTPVMHRAARRAALTTLAAAVATLSVLAACSADTNDPLANHVPDENGVYWELRLNHAAVTMAAAAPYDTLRLVPTAYNVKGDPLPQAAQDSAVTTYRLADPSDTSVTVTPGGVIHAWHPDARAVIYVRTTLQGITRSDSVVLMVTEAPWPSRFSRLALALSPTDTVRTNDFFTQTVLTAEALDAAYQPISGARGGFRTGDRLLVQLFGTDPAIRTLFVGESGRAGRTWLYASATIYGVTRRDSTRVNVSWPYSANVSVRFVTPRGSTTPVGYFEPQVDTVARGGMVVWQFGPDQVIAPIDVVFDKPSAAAAATGPFVDFCSPGGSGSGNIPAFAPDTTKACGNSLRFRSFPTPGTYAYHSARYGSTGTIVVLP